MYKMTSENRLQLKTKPSWIGHRTFSSDQLHKIGVAMSTPGWTYNSVIMELGEDITNKNLKKLLNHLYRSNNHPELKNYKLVPPTRVNNLNAIDQIFGIQIVHRICSLMSRDNWSVASIIKELKIPPEYIEKVQHAIHNIYSESSYRYISKDYDIKKITKYRKIKYKYDIESICKDIVKGRSLIFISRINRCSTNLVGLIKSKKMHKEISDRFF